MIRQRKINKAALDAIKNLDVLTKVQEEYVEPTRLGGGISIVAKLFIILFVYSEIKHFFDRKILFVFKPDVDLMAKLKMNIDLTIAMPCNSIGADILDSTNQNVFSFGTLQEEDTWFELDENQQLYFEYVKQLNTYLRKEWYNINELLYKDQKETIYNLPKRIVKPNKPYDACRIYGSLTLNKVSGNLHVTAGRSLQFPQGHIHVNIIFNDPMKSNFSHRIHKFSFGEKTANFLHPLEGEEKFFQKPNTMMQYYVEVVPTEIHLNEFSSPVKSYQYSVKENIRTVDHETGSHGVPGLYFKYDIAALKIIVTSKYRNVIHTLTRLSSIIAGIVVISSVIHSILYFITSKINNK